MSLGVTEMTEIGSFSERKGFRSDCMKLPREKALDVHGMEGE